MAPRGRPALTEETLRDRTAAYCERYGVKGLNQEGLPPYPAGRRETRQHRDWVNLLKAWSRFRRRTASSEGTGHAAALRAQAGQCPICLKKVRLSEATKAPASVERTTPLVHPVCGELLRLVDASGPSLLDRLKDYFWSEPLSSRRSPGKDR